MATGDRRGVRPPDYSVPLVTFRCDTSASMNQTTAPTRKLAGIWIRVCKWMPRKCGPSQYIDNPYT